MFISMFNDIELERKDNADSCAFFPQGRPKNMFQHLTMDTGHSWVPEKTASVFKDMQYIMATRGIFARHKWWEISRIMDIKYSSE